MAALAAIGPHRSALPEAIALHTMAFAGLLLLWFRHRDRLDSTWILIGGAAALRLLFLPTLPDLSDDLFRYVWDGHLSRMGVNPFRFVPIDPALEGIGDPSLLASLNSPDYFSIYPPLSQIVFLLGGFFHELWGWPASGYAVKAGFMALEFGGVLLLLRALLRFGLAPGSLALYAWNPLVVVTLAGSGHTEGGLVFALGLLLWGVSAARPGAAWTGWALAVCSKAIPLLLAPLLFLHLKGRVGTRAALRGLALGGAVGLALSIPFFFPGLPARMASSADLYVRLFEFNAGPYLAIKSILSLLTGEDWSKFLGPAFRLVFLASAVLVWMKWPVKRAPDAVRGFMLVFALYLTFATTVHPWYLIWGLALVPFTPFLRGAWLWASWAALPTYLTYTGASHGALTGLFWGGVVVAVLWETRDALLHRLLRLVAVRKARGIRPHLRGTRILDLGGGEGYVGARLAGEGVNVCVAEVEAYRGAELPRILFDGERLPFRDGAFDSVVLSLVLHHARDPDRLLAEALRVSSGPVVVTESLYRWRWERHLLEWVDRGVNRGRGEGGMARDPEPVRFRTEPEWKAAFQQAGAELVHSRRLNRVGHRHHLFVVEP